MIQLKSPGFACCKFQRLHKIIFERVFFPSFLASYLFQYALKITLQTLEINFQVVALAGQYSVQY